MRPSVYSVTEDRPDRPSSPLFQNANFGDGIDAEPSKDIGFCKKMYRCVLEHRDLALISVVFNHRERQKGFKNVYSNNRSIDCFHVCPARPTHEVLLRRTPFILVDMLHRIEVPLDEGRRAHHGEKSVVGTDRAS